MTLWCRGYIGITSAPKKDFSKNFPAACQYFPPPSTTRLRKPSGVTRTHARKRNLTLAWLDIHLRGQDFAPLSRPWIYRSHAASSGSGVKLSSFVISSVYISMSPPPFVHATYFFRRSYRSASVGRILRGVAICQLQLLSTAQVL